jgi:hypothetical protein
MSFAYGYDLEDGDKILEAPEWAVEILSSFVLPGAALVNHLPFCTVSDFVPAITGGVSQSFQCGTSLRGSHTSATNHWQK